MNTRAALNNLISAKLRSFLALLGILVGVASVVAMVSGGELATREALKQVKGLGTDLLAVTISDWQADEKPLRDTKVTVKDVYAMAKLNPQIMEAAPYSQAFLPVQYNGHKINGGILGVTQAFADNIQIKLQRGRFISSMDEYKLYCVIGDKIYQQMKAISYQDPVGSQVTLGNTLCTVVGVAKPWPQNGFVYADIDESVLIPLLASTTLTKFVAIYNIIFKLAPNANLDQISAQLNAFVSTNFADKHIYIRSAKELLQSLKKQTRILTLMLGMIGGIALFVGGIGVMNIMLVSVIERRREIGIRRALGAKQSDIRNLFLLEALLLSLVGGILGVILGVTVEWVIATIWHWEFEFFFLPITLGFFVSASVGIFFGYYPAKKAALLDPIESLRME